MYKQRMKRWIIYIGFALFVLLFCIATIEPVEKMF